MEIKLDIHIHSSASPDSKSTPEQIFARAREVGLNTIGIADHGTVEGALQARKLSRDIRVLAGQEVLTKQGEVLVFNLEENLEQRQDLLQTCRKAKDKGAFIIVPHPFDPLRSGIGSSIKKILHLIDALEVFNSKCFMGRTNSKARAFAEQNKLPMVAGSDAHLLHDIGNAINVYNTPKAPKTDKDFHSLIKTQTPEMITKRFNMLMFMKSKMGVYTLKT